MQIKLTSDSTIIIQRMTKCDADFVTRLEGCYISELHVRCHEVESVHE